MWKRLVSQSPRTPRGDDGDSDVVVSMCSLILFLLFCFLLVFFEGPLNKDEVPNPRKRRR